MSDFEHLYNAYFNAVYLYILRLSGNEHIAEEITSETFFRAMHSINSFRGDCDARVWLCQIAKNRYFSYLKRAEKTQSIDENGLSELPDVSESIQEEFAKKDEAARIQRILHSISEPYKEVFMWRVYGELSFKEIGQIFKKSENWACVTYHRARRIIKHRLEEKKI